MAFFGLTYLGSKSTFGSTLHTKTLLDFTDDDLLNAYKRTEALQGKGDISIDELRILLSYVYGGLPPEREVGLLTHYCDFMQRGPVAPGEGSEKGILLRVSSELLLQAAAKVRADVDEALTFKKIAGVTNVAREFTSHEHFQEHAHKHLRSHYAPQDRYKKPVTTQQEIGWFTPAKVEQVDRKPNKSCPETRYAAKMHMLQ